MGVFGGPQGPKNGMLFCMDAANPKAHSPVGNTYFRSNVGSVVQHQWGNSLGTTKNGANPLTIAASSLGDHSRLVGTTTGLFQCRSVSYPSGNYGGDEGLATFNTSDPYDCDG